jgi:hypothetical protein
MLKGYGTRDAWGGRPRRLLPEFDANEVHAVEVEAESAAAVAALLAGAAAAAGVVPRLLRLRDTRRRLAREPGSAAPSGR